MKKLEFRDLIIKHYQSPKAFGFTNDLCGVKVRHNSEYCVDDITIEIVKEDNKIKTARFEGVACTVATSVVDIFCLEIEGKQIEEVAKLIESFKGMINAKIAQEHKQLGKLGSYGLVANEPKRARCALIPADVILQCITKL